MKLYVDDVRPAPYGWHLARTITEAIRILATMYVEEISLDHDIGFLEGQEDNAETFEPVARYIALMPKETKPLIHVHSGNPLALEKYANILYGEKNENKN